MFRLKLNNLLPTDGSLSLKDVAWHFGEAFVYTFYLSMLAWIIAEVK